MSRRIVVWSAALVLILFAASWINRLSEGRVRSQRDRELGFVLTNATIKGDRALVAATLPKIHRLNVASAASAVKVAAERNHVEILRLLLDAGMHVDESDGAYYGMTPLHMAALRDRPTTARLLLDRGADIEARAPGGGTALTMAAGEGHPAMVRLLLDRGADWKLANKNGDTALRLAWRGKSKKHREVERMLRNVAKSRALAQ